MRLFLAPKEHPAHQMKTVVFSDVHLPSTPETAHVRAEFIRFLGAVVTPDVNRVIILGDLFDFWFEYRTVVFSGYFDVLCAFAALRDRGVEMHLVCGNHDFWAGPFLEQHLGFHVHRGPVVMAFGSKRVLMAHGDGENARDFGYRIYKRIASAAPVIWMFRQLHPDCAMALARIVSRTSRNLSQVKDPTKGAEAAALRAFAARTLAEGKADVVMAGHAHAPAYEGQHPTPNGPGIYINAGDWMYHRSYVEWDGTEFRLLNA
jgi:UDP-2,3-diacylglucosamine hydrolase